MTVPVGQAGSARHHAAVYLLRLVVLAAIVSALTGCRTAGFYAQAAHGQWAIMAGARPTADLLRADSGIADTTRRRLQLVEEIRAFATTRLGLPADRQYDRFTDLGRPWVVWVVFAAPEFSIEAKTWTYPILGRLDYRGWFTEEAACREAEALRRRGYDVHVAGTDAYSTLGWLRDPVLSTFIDRPVGELAELIFHELTHQVLYLPGDTDFNEAFATAIGQAGARQWLRATGRWQELADYEHLLRHDRDRVRLLLDARASLATLYARRSSMPEADLRAAKAQAFATLRRRLGQLPAPPPDPKPRARTLNNATLAGIAAYYDLLPAFERLLAACDHRIPDAIAAVARLKHLPHDARISALNGNIQDFPH